MPIRESAVVLEDAAATAAAATVNAGLRRAMRRQARIAALALRAPNACLLIGPVDQPSLFERYGRGSVTGVPLEALETLAEAAEPSLLSPARWLITTIRTESGTARGFLWVIGAESKRWSPRERKLLQSIAVATGAELELRRGADAGNAPGALEPEGSTLSTAALLRERSDDQLLLALREGILSAVHEGEAEAGTRLPSIREVADRIGTTRYSVLQAYRALEGEGIVEKRHRSGVYVASLGETPLPRLPETAGWLGKVITESYLHQVKLPALPALIQRWTASTTIRCACIESSEDYRTALADEIRLHFGLDAVSVPVPSSDGNGDVLAKTRAELERRLDAADVLVTTPFHAPEMGRVAERLGIPMIVATLGEDSYTVPVRRLADGNELVLVCVDPGFADRVIHSVPASLRSRIRVVTTDSLAEIEALDRSEPVLMTGAARARLTGADFRLLAAHFPSFSRRFAERLAPMILRINLEHLRRGTARA